MSVSEQNALIRAKDASGNSLIIYPITKADNVDGLDEKLDSINNEITSKANVSHAHNISDVNGLQSKLNGKQDTITGAASTVASSNLSTNCALVSNSSGKIGVLSSVSSTELGYLDGVTSGIQTQLNNKAASTHIHDYNDLTNKPCYENRTLSEIYISSTYRPSASALYSNTNYYYGTKSGGSLSINPNSTYLVNGTGITKGDYVCYATRSGYTYYYILGNPMIFKSCGYDSLVMSNGGEVIDTGDDWCFVSYNSTAMNAIYSTTKSCSMTYAAKVTTEIVQLDEKFIPDTISDAAKTYADSGDSTTLASAKSYTDEQLAGLSQIQFITWEADD